MQTVDYIIVFGYILAIFITGIAVGLRETVEDFLVNNRTTRLTLLIFSVVSTNVGAATYIGITAAAYSSGVSYGLSAMFIVFIGFLLVAFFAPHLKQLADKHKLHTVADFYLVCFSNRNKDLAALIVFIGYFLFMAAQFTGGALILRQWTNMGTLTSVIIAGATMIIYTAYAGIKSDFYTDAIHFIVMFVSFFFFLIPNIYNHLGSINVLGSLDSSFFSPFSYGGLYFFIFSIILGLPLMLVSMEIWQRIFAAVDERTAKRSLIISGIINVPFILGMIFLGLALKYLNPNLNDNQMALFFLMSHYLPPVVLGIAVAGLFAAILSTANSMIMVNSATFAKDWFFTGKREKELQSGPKTLIKLRVITFIIGALGMGVAYYLGDILQLIVDGFQVIAVLAPSILLGIFSVKSERTEKAAFYSMLSGLITTAGVYYFIPKTAFVPGILVSSIVLGVIMFIFKKQKAVITK